MPFYKVIFATAGTLRDAEKGIKMSISFDEDLTWFSQCMICLQVCKANRQLLITITSCKDCPIVRRQTFCRFDNVSRISTVALEKS